MTADVAKACSHVPEQAWAGRDPAAGHWPHGQPPQAGPAAQVGLALAVMWVALLSFC